VPWLGCKGAGGLNQRRLADPLESFEPLCANPGLLGGERRWSWDEAKGPKLDHSKSGRWK
jgi:hypothetical protein